ncbi:MAG: type II toxin-antitoxin system VapC family toxin [Deltaproteobacteria bacterium]|nr:type II toxin-antitoxin system VapC family toxin [Deltaproteobacteria bacterium]MBI3388753.1 type II toxin-antitoxin system VapC family toxin [Deltaproteobacteria bacterium]
MLYIDTSVLLVYTLTQTVERERYRPTAEFFAHVASGALAAATSFYALHEVHVFALNSAPDFSVGAAYGRAALVQILSLPLQLFPLLSRVERRRHAARFASLRDSSDLPHAVAAAIHGCEAIVTYDSHFDAVSTVLPCRRPEDFLAQLPRG